jgi:hypothetical protein
MSKSFWSGPGRTHTRLGVSCRCRSGFDSLCLGRVKVRREHINWKVPNRFHGSYRYWKRSLSRIFSSGITVDSYVEPLQFSNGKAVMRVKGALK